MTLSFVIIGLTTTRFWSLSSYFEGAVGLVFAEIVDWVTMTNDDVSSKKEHAEKRTVGFAAHAAAIYDALFYNFADWQRGWYEREQQKERD